MLHQLATCARAIAIAVALFVAPSCGESHRETVWTSYPLAEGGMSDPVESIQRKSETIAAFEARRAAFLSAYMLDYPPADGWESQLVETRRLRGETVAVFELRHQGQVNRSLLGGGPLPEFGGEATPGTVLVSYIRADGTASEPLELVRQASEASEAFKLRKYVELSAAMLKAPAVDDWKSWLVQTESLPGEDVTIFGMRHRTQVGRVLLTRASEPD